MKVLEGKASDILKNWVDGNLDVYYKFFGHNVSQIELFDKDEKTGYLPSEEVKHYLEIILTYDRQG